MFIDLLDGIDEEINSFSQAERPFWPDSPTCCPVTNCDQALLYHSFSSFQRHWDNKHLPVVKLFECPSCSFVSAREYNVRRHLRLRHKLKTSQALVSRDRPNKTWIDPKDVMPFRFNHRERMANKRRSQDTPAEVLVRGGEVCRDQEATLDGSVIFKNKRTLQTNTH